MNAPVRLLATLNFAALAASALAQMPSGKRLNYPVARSDRTVDTYFGTSMPPQYQWVEDLKSPGLNW